MKKWKFPFDLQEMLIVSIILGFTLYYLYSVNDAYWEVSVYPKILCTLLIICMMILFVSSVKKQKVTSSQDKVQKNGSKMLPYFGTGIISLLLMIFVFGYLPAIMIYLFLNLKFLGVQNNKLIIGITLFFSISLYYVFNNLLYVRLPQGLFFG